MNAIFPLLALQLVAPMAAHEPVHSPLEVDPATPLAAAVTQALSPTAVRQGGTTPRAAVLTGNNELGDLSVGTPVVMDAIERAIASAREEVLVQVYQWVDEDEASRCVRDALDRRLHQAVLRNETFRVGLLVGNAARPEHPLQIRQTIDMLERHSHHHPHLRVEVLAFDGTLFDILHSKTVVIDGRMALVSTANFFTHGGLNEDSFNMAAAVRGPVVAALMQDWHHARHHSRGLFQRHLATVPYLPSEDAAWQSRDAERGARETEQFRRARPFAREGQWLQASVLSRPARNIFRFGGEMNPQAQGLLALFHHAQKYIVAINPALNVPAYKDAMIKAIVERDVEVHLLLSFHMNRRRQHMLMGGDNSDTALDLYTRLLREGGEAAADRLHFYFGTDTRGELAPASHPGNIHAKAASFDGDAFVIGSTNWDWPSYNSARELSVVLFGPGVGHAFEDEVFAHRLLAARPILASDLPAKAQRQRSRAYRYLDGRR